MDQAIADAAARGALDMLGPGHSRSQIFADRVQARRTVINAPLLWGRHPRPCRRDERDGPCGLVALGALRAAKAGNRTPSRSQ